MAAALEVILILLAEIPEVFVAMAEVLAEVLAVLAPTFDKLAAIWAERDGTLALAAPMATLFCRMPASRAAR